MRICLLLLVLCASLEAGWVRVGENWSTQRCAPTLSVGEHYDNATTLLQEKKWSDALEHYQVIIYHFQQSPFYADSVYHVAVCYFFLGHFDLADKHFGFYLNTGGTLKHFEKVFEFKYHIAEYYREGRKKHLFGREGLPRVISGKGSAFELYNEVIASLPSREIAAKALASKADLLRSKKDFKSSIETLNVLIRRFPKHHLSAEAYITIGEIYLQQVKREAQNPDLIALAQVNMQRFHKSFPGDERSQHLEAQIFGMQEVHAASLFETGRFYERLKHPRASAIYYNDTIVRFPETESAKKSQERLKKLSI